MVAAPVAGTHPRACAFIPLNPSCERTDLMAIKITPTEARQGTGPRAMFWVLTASIALAVIAGLLLGLGWVSLP